MKAKRILTVAYGGGHSRMLIPVIRKMRQNGMDVLSLACTLGLADMKSAGLPFISYIDLMSYLSPAEKLRLSIYEPFIRSLPLNPLVPRSESYAYYGINFLALDKRYESPDRVIEDYKTQGRSLFSPEFVMERLISRADPALVIATNSPRTEKAAIDIAKKLGRHTLCAVDLFFFNNPHVADPDFCDYWAVFSESIRSKLSLVAGVPPNRIFVTGNPAFDNLSIVSEKRRNRLVGRSERDQTVNLLWISAPEPDRLLPVKVLEDLLRIKRKYGLHVHLTVRLHATEGKKANSVYGDGLYDCDFVDQEISIEQCLAGTDVAIAFSSTLAVQAASAGIPTAQVLGSAYDRSTPLADYGLVDAAVTFGHDQQGSLSAWLREKIETIRRGKPIAIAESNLSISATDRFISAVHSIIE